VATGGTKTKSKTKKKNQRLTDHMNIHSPQK